MRLLELLRKGLGYALLSMGVSRPAPKPRPDSSATGQSGKGRSLRG